MIVKKEDFECLLHRSFLDTNTQSQRFEKKSIGLDVKTETFGFKDFNLMNFSSRFYKDIEVNGIEEFTHISMHFQLEGHSTAYISGISGDNYLSSGKFNIINCIDPKSDFAFPRQDRYQYFCLGITHDRFWEMAEEHPNAINIFREMQASAPGKLFEKPRYISKPVLDAFQQIKYAPIADTLRRNYIKSKIEEIIWLSLSDAVIINSCISEQVDADKMYALRSFLEENYLNPLSMKDIVKTIGLNAFKIKQGYKSTFGESVFQTIHRLRMDYGYKLLLMKRTTISEVATIVGYETDASFSRAFKSYYGHRPSDLKK